MPPPTTQQQTQQHAQQQAENAVNQLAQAHGLFGGVNWGQLLLPIFIQLIQTISSNVGGAGAAQQQSQAGQKQSP